MINQHDHTTKVVHPHKFQDWEGKDLEIRSKELKKGTFNHAYEAGVSTDTDLVDCPVQPDPTKDQRQDCSQITDETMTNFGTMMQSLPQSTESSMIKFTLPMEYFDSQNAVYYLDTSTGHAAIYHESGKYWG